MNTTAQTILSQLGGNKFVAMTGAKNFTYGHGATLAFGFKKSHGVNHCQIVLEGDDTYTVKLADNNARRLTYTTLQTIAAVHAAELETVFALQTGLATRL